MKKLKISCLAFALFLCGFNEIRATFIQKKIVQTGDVKTPQKGSAERKAILDAFRTVWLKNSEIKSVIFNVDRMSVKNGWAYIQVTPQSPDGSNNYETEGALLRKTSGKWKVVKRLGGDTDCDLPCLKKKYPSMPKEIYPAN